MQIIPQATIITPNQYEAELLSGSKISTEDEAWKVMTHLHDKGPQTVVITSLDPSVSGENQIVLLVSRRRVNSNDVPLYDRVRAVASRIPTYFTGTGDLLSALLLARLHEFPSSSGLDGLVKAMTMALASLQAVMRETVKHCPKEALHATMRTSAVARERELRLVQSQHAISVPPVEDMPDIKVEALLDCQSLKKEETISDSNGVA